MKRIVFTVALGQPKYAEMAMGLARSLKLIGDDTPRAILTDIPGYDWQRYFEHVIPPQGEEKHMYFNKLRALELTDADQVLFIDSDCLAFKRVDRIFDYCQGAPMAACGFRRTAGTWYDKDIAELCGEHGIESIPYINSGVLYYDRSDDARVIMARAREFADVYQSLNLEIFRGKVPDEPCLALAMATTGKGVLIPTSLDFNISGVGLIGKLRMDVLKGECKFLMRGHSVRLVEPTILHAHYYSKFLVYWRQLEKLKWLERYEDTHPPRHMHRGWKIRRSIERRLLKHWLGKL
jgi:hypothetical protein